VWTFIICILLFVIQENIMLHVLTFLGALQAYMKQIVISCHYLFNVCLKIT
jgi:hypothetical protein